MNVPPISRRQFLAAVAGLVGVAAATRASTATKAPITTTTPASSATTSTTRIPSTTTTMPQPAGTIATAVGVVQAICRSAWGEREPSGPMTSHTIDRMTVHHTASLLEGNQMAPALARVHENRHMVDQGWVDLAYHFLVDANGNVYEGRPVTAVGDTMTDYDPTGHFLVCAEGDFNNQAIPAAQVSAVADVLAWGAVHFEVDPSTIQGHRDWATTSCPGDNFYSLISEGNLEQAVRDRIAAGAPGLSILCGDAAEQRVADIEAGLA